MKIEELNAHISSLYVENLRLRASEIALQSQLKREKVKSHKIMADAEAAVRDSRRPFTTFPMPYFAVAVLLVLPRISVADRMFYTYYSILTGAQSSQTLRHHPGIIQRAD